MTQALTVGCMHPHLEAVMGDCIRLQLELRSDQSLDVRFQDFLNAAADQGVGRVDDYGMVWLHWHQTDGDSFFFRVNFRYAESSIESTNFKDYVPAFTASVESGSGDSHAQPPAGSLTTARWPADWHPDPCGRHRWRYWDGHAWTDKVANGGRVLIDPVASSQGKASQKPVALRVVAALWAASNFFYLAPFVALFFEYRFPEYRDGFSDEVGGEGIVLVLIILGVSAAAAGLYAFRDEKP